MTESKAFAEKAGKDLSNLKDTIIEEAPFDELKDVAERLTPVLKKLQKVLILKVPLKCSNK